MERFYPLLIMFFFFISSCDICSKWTKDTNVIWDWEEISDSIEKLQFQELRDYDESISKCNSLRKDKKITSFLTNQMEINDTIVIIEVISDLYLMGPPSNRLWIKNKKDSTYVVYRDGYENKTDVRIGAKHGRTLEKIEKLCENWNIDSLKRYSKSLEDSAMVLDYYYTKHMATIVVLLDSNKYIVKCQPLGRIQ